MSPYISPMKLTRWVLPKVVFRKLGKHRSKDGYGIWGLASDPEFGHKERMIELDSRLRNRKKMETMIHECAHIASPNLSEMEVDRIAKMASRVLWRHGYRETHQ